MIKACDYSFSRPDLAYLYSQGYRVVLRYFSFDDAKNLSPAELEAIQANKMGVGIFVEQGATDFLFTSRMQPLAIQVKDLLSSMKIPVDVPLFCAFDFDVQQNQLKTLTDNLNLFKSYLPDQLIGTYGSVWYEGHPFCRSMSTSFVEYNGTTGQAQNHPNPDIIQSSSTISGIDDDTINNERLNFMTNVSSAVTSIPQNSNSQDIDQLIGVLCSLLKWKTPQPQEIHDLSVKEGISTQLANLKLIEELNQPAFSLPQSINYTVQAGDTLTSIAQHFGVTVQSLATKNNIQNINSIQTGEKLIV